MRPTLFRCAVPAVILLLAAAAPAAQFAGGIAHHFESEMTVVLEVPGFGTQTVELRGPTTVLVGERREDGGVGVVDTEVVAMQLEGDFLGQDVTVRASPDRSSVGEVRAQGAGDDFPADSFFDVFVEVELGALGVLVNLEPVRVQADDLRKLPPLFDTYRHPPPAIPLVAKSDPNGPVIASIQGESSHRPIEDPTFSLAAGGSLEPASGYGLPKPPTVRLTRAGLDLVAGDDIDAISYGVDGIDEPGATTLGFSVHPASAGAAGTGVAQQAALGTQEGAEFVSHVDSTNQLLVDPDLLVPVPATDDVDALVDYPASVVDTNGDGTPENPVFLSLAPGSPTLATLGASPADVLVSVGGVISIFATAASFGAQPGDDLDAMCLMKASWPNTTLRPGSTAADVPPPGGLLFDAMLFSLAPGSPTLAAQGHGPADLFLTNFSNSRPNLATTPLALYADAAELGLLQGDDLDALKCMRPVVMFELDGDGDLDGASNGAGCGDPGPIDAAIELDAGPRNVSTDPSAERGEEYGDFNFWNTWSIQNPVVSDYHGPYALPDTPEEDAGLVAGDPAVDVFFVGGPGDNCGLPHVHGPFGYPQDTFGFHADLDPLACGHGVFVPHPVPIQVIPTRRDVPTVAHVLAALFAARFGEPSIFPMLAWAAAHAYDGPRTNFDISECKIESRRRYILLLSGLAITQANLQWLPFQRFSQKALQRAGGGSVGDDGAVAPPIRIGPALRTLQPPLFIPEPSAGAGALAAALALAALARRRRR